MLGSALEHVQGLGALFCPSHIWLESQRCVVISVVGCVSGSSRFLDVSYGISSEQCVLQHRFKGCEHGPFNPGLTSLMTGSCFFFFFSTTQNNIL